MQLPRRRCSSGNEPFRPTFTLGFTVLRKRGCVGLMLAEGRMCLCGARRRANRAALLRLDRTGSQVGGRMAAVFESQMTRLAGLARSD